MSVALCSMSVGGVVASNRLLITFGSMCAMVAATVVSKDLPNRIPWRLTLSRVVILERRSWSHSWADVLMQSAVVW